MPCLPNFQAREANEAEPKVKRPRHERVPKEAAWMIWLRYQGKKHTQVMGSYRKLTRHLFDDYVVNLKLFCLSQPWLLHVVISAVKRSFWATISFNSSHVLCSWPCIITKTQTNELC